MSLYFDDPSKDSLGYTLGRVPINSCDFSPASYNFDNVTGDDALAHFDDSVKHDVDAGMIPMILDAQARVAKRGYELKMFASPWSPPAWMKLPVEGATPARSMLTSATLNMRSLNRVNIFKECFLGYVNAGMLEPLLALSSGEYDITAKSAIINACQLLGLFSWLYLLTDAFDFTDTQQSFVYWSRVLGKPGRPADKTRAALAKLPAGLPPSTVPRRNLR